MKVNEAIIRIRRIGPFLLEKKSENAPNYIIIIRRISFIHSNEQRLRATEIDENIGIWDEWKHDGRMSDESKTKTTTSLMLIPSR